MLCLPLWVQADQISFLSLDDDSYWQVWRADTVTGAVHQVTFSPYDKSTHSWFPDGQYMLVNGNQGQLVKVDVHSGDEVPVTIPMHGFNDAMLSPDGTTLAFSFSSSESVNDNNIWLVNLKTQQKRKLTNLASLQYEPMWSSDGKDVYFVSATNINEQDLWMVDVQTGDKKQLTLNSMFNLNAAKHQQGGLVYSSNRTGNYELWWKENGKAAKQITNNPELDGHPFWLSSGEELVYESYRNGRARIFLFDIKTQTEQELKTMSQDARKPVAYQEKVTGVAP